MSRSEYQRIVTPEQIERIHQTTDRFGLSRDGVTIPMIAEQGPGKEMVFPDGRLFIKAAGDADFEPWFAGLADRLSKMDLAKVPRAKPRTAR